MVRHPLSFTAKQNSLNPMHHVKLGVRARSRMEKAWTSTGGTRRVEGLELPGWMDGGNGCPSRLLPTLKLWKLWASSLEPN